jgi:hypothetical protein
VLGNPRVESKRKISSAFCLFALKFLGSSTPNSMPDGRLFMKATHLASEVAVDLPAPGTP